MVWDFNLLEMQNCDDLMDVGQEVVFMYERQQLMADDHVNKRVDMNAHDDDDDTGAGKTNNLPPSSHVPEQNKLQTVDEVDEDGEEE